MKPLIPYFEPFSIPIVGEIGIHGFGILVAIGFVAATRGSIYKAVRDGLEADFINRFVGWAVAGVFIGGHLGHLFFYYPEDFLKDPTEIFKVWRGLSSFGGFITTVAFGVFFFKGEIKKRQAENRRRHGEGEPLLPAMPIWGYADAIVFGSIFGWGFGRMGCFAAHDHAGTQTDFWLGVYGMCPPMGRDLTVACHDLGLYEAIFSFCVFGVFLLLDKKPRFPGFYAGLMLLIYGPFRLFLDAFRHPETDTRYLGLTPAQYGSMLMIVLGMLVFAKRRHLKPLRVADVRGASPGPADGLSSAPTPSAAETVIDDD